MDYRSSLATVLVGIVLIAGCASSGNGDYAEELPIPDSTTSVTRGDLKVGPMDTLQVSVFGVNELDGSYQVDFDGFVRLPLVGEVSAVGKTASELAVELEQKYEERFLQDPDVNVTIADSVGRRITLDGAVSKRGLYPVTGGMTLLQAVALGGGPTPGANPSRVLVFRQINGERHAASFNLLKIRSGEANDPQIYGNDIIVVDGSEARATYGEVLRSLPLVAFFLAF